jgi:hypothetical protein
VQDDPEFRWMTYRQLADSLGVSLRAAEARVRRAGWRREPGNDGAARVAVPEGALREAARGNTDERTGRDTNPHGLDLMLRRLATELDQAQTLLDQRTGELAEAREALAEQKGTVIGLKEAVRIAEAATTEAAYRASEAGRQASDARKEAELAEARAREESQRADRADEELSRLRARGWWARLRNRD